MVGREGKWGRVVGRQGNRGEGGREGNWGEGGREGG